MRKTCNEKFTNEAVREKLVLVVFVCFGSGPVRDEKNCGGEISQHYQPLGLSSHSLREEMEVLGHSVTNGAHTSCQTHTHTQTHTVSDEGRRLIEV